ncbi:amidohydrolase [Streptomyces viridochromogenes]|uniref:Amidohydrolase n=1 Tax=Streptomyces viridochromogenes TaxID=1938 RepID=A0A0J7ZMF8_STRVR|nr:amidohydrolase [Streptomyces viridochromogenes]KMS76567.1 amidohydrolase [Streptomyces viridochromogenes]KOG23344.1 amidohydrolase [Streptomyces viridochromogenes]KOG27048.1 amidohydrolase [Streptomyces viridochromogenes]
MNDSAPSLILTGGQVLTVDGDFTVAEGVAVHGRDIVAVGSDREMRALAGPGTRVVELAGRSVLPGINDSHLHGAAYGMTKPPFALDVGHPTVGSIADIAATVERAVSAARPGEWIVGLGWDAGYLAECLADPRRFPHRLDLDAVAPDNPVCLTHFSSHLVWVNSAALRRCGIGPASAPPAGGVIDTDPGGEPTGILREAAQELVQADLPSPTVAQRRQAIQGVVRELHSRGITSYTEPGLGPGGATSFFGGLSTDNWTAYADLAASGDLQARVSVLLLPAPMGGSADDVRKGLAELRRPTSADPRLLNAIGVKIFADGVPPNRTAWMREPYADGGHGALCVHGESPALQVDELFEMIRVAHEAGFQLGVHVTGDLAIDTVVDAFLAANAAVPRPDARHYVIHGDFVGADSLAKLASHGYGVNMNPAIKWTISDLMDEVVGTERSAYQWPVRSAVEAGVTVCASSDAPITEPDWRQGVAAMMLRESKASGRPSGPEQCVPLAEALRAYTVNPARQDFAEDWKGTVEVGKVADLCVLDRPLLDLDPHAITDAQVDLTVFDGRVVHER